MTTRKVRDPARERAIDERRSHLPKPRELQEQMNYLQLPDAASSLTQGAVSEGAVGISKAITVSVISRFASLGCEKI